MNRHQLIDQLKFFRHKGVDLGIPLTTKTDLLTKRLNELSINTNSYIHDDLLTVLLYKVHPSILVRLSSLSKQISSISLKEKYWEGRIKKEHLIMHKPREINWRGWYLQLNRIPIGGRVEAWGDNDLQPPSGDQRSLDLGELGFPSKKSYIPEKEQQAVILIEGKKDYSSKIIDIGISLTKTYFLTDNGRLWLTSTTYPSLIVKLNKIRIKSFLGVGNYLIVLTDDYKIYSIASYDYSMKMMPGNYNLLIANKVNPNKFYIVDLLGNMFDCILEYNFQGGGPKITSLSIPFNLELLPNIKLLLKNDKYLINSKYFEVTSQYPHLHFERII